MTDSPDWQSSPVIKNVVVQDGGKLLVVGTLYGGLTMSLSHDDSEFTMFARVALVELAAMLFVDIMRLFCVSGSDAARSANATRYGEFIGIADQHIKELSAQITRLVAAQDAVISIEASDVEKKLVWAVERLRGDHVLDRSWSEMATRLATIAMVTRSFCERAAPEYYARCQADASTTLEEWKASRPRISLADAFVRARFGIQSRLLVRLKRSVGLDIGTIKDDIDRVLAVPYFTIDNVLLGVLAAQLATQKENN
ncbi:MAG: hypothetical protein WAQ52_00955 [Terriglobales bacterium]